MIAAVRVDERPIATSVHRWTGSASNSPAHGLTKAHTMPVALSATAFAQPAPGALGGAFGPAARITAVRTSIHASAVANAVTTSAETSRAPSDAEAGSIGVPGASGPRPENENSLPTAKPIANGSAAAKTHTNHAPTAWR